MCISLMTSGDEQIPEGRCTAQRVSRVALPKCTWWYVWGKEKQFNLVCLYDFVHILIFSF